VPRTVPFWTEDFPKPTALGTDDLPHRTDVAIIGSGVTGLAAARRLARAGAAVTVLDSGPLSGGASSISGGMTTTGLKASAPEVVARYGKERGLALWHASHRAVDLIEEIVRDDSIECDFSRSGGAGLGTRDRDLRRFQESAKWLRDHADYRMRVVGPSDMRTVVGSDQFVAAYIDDRSGGLHPAKFTYGLAASVSRSGGLLVERAEVTSIDRHASGYRVATTKGALSAGAVLVATNGYTGPLLPQIRRGIVPIGSYIVVTERLGRELAERLIPSNRMLWTSRRFLNYFRRTPDERLLMGGRQSLRTDLDLEESARRLGKTIVDFFPDLAGVSLTHSWSGRLGVTFDLVPHIGRLEGIWYALGYSGHGMPLGTYLGNEVAGLMTGELEGSPFADIPYPTRWYYRQRPWFLPLATWWYRLVDRIG